MNSRSERIQNSSQMHASSYRFVPKFAHVPATLRQEKTQPYKAAWSTAIWCDVPVCRTPLHWWFDDPRKVHPLMLFVSGGFRHCGGAHTADGHLRSRFEPRKVRGTRCAMRQLALRMRRRATPAQASLGAYRLLAGSQARRTMLLQGKPRFDGCERRGRSFGSGICRDSRLLPQAGNCRAKKVLALSMFFRAMVFDLLSCGTSHATKIVRSCVRYVVALSAHQEFFVC